VLIDVPKDVQTQSVTQVFAGSDASSGTVDESLGAERRHHSRYREAAELIQSAKRPVLYVGGGVVKARAHRILRQFAEHISIPVTSGVMQCCPARSETS
jgi:acetolactate synthase-1/2/3 large subunit